MVIPDCGEERVDLIAALSGIGVIMVCVSSCFCVPRLS